jgi:hypothetical protein
MMVRKGLIFQGILVVMLALPALCEAAVKGTCSVCHTMHNSEQGVAVAFTVDGTGQIGGRTLREEAFAKLLKTDCIGCHSYGGAETLVEMGEGGKVPIVLNFIEPTYPPDGSTTSTLAGGNFHWVINNGDPYGHNVNGISGPDFRFPPTQAPGGVPRSGECTNCHGTLVTSTSGCDGCHVPQHHADSMDVVAGRAKGWYRFLGSVMQRTGLPEPTLEGVVGIEAPDWEQNPLTTQHNVYQGKPGPYSSYLESGAIDQKCVGCHGQFHNATIANSTWIRHPVDVAIPDFGEFAGFTTYNPLVPVARQNVSSLDVGFSQINRGSDVVACISCHRPHGSPYPAMLRWAYRDWPGTDSHTQQPAFNGCAVCHTSKD